VFGSALNGEDAIPALVEVMGLVAAQVSVKSNEVKDKKTTVTFSITVAEAVLLDTRDIIENNNDDFTSNMGKQLGLGGLVTKVESAAVSSAKNEDGMEISYAPTEMPTSLEDAVKNNAGAIAGGLVGALIFCICVGCIVKYMCCGEDDDSEKKVAENEMAQTVEDPATTAGSGATSGGDDDLPEGWEAKTDPNSGQTYYNRIADGVTQWEKPTAADL